MSIIVQLSPCYLFLLVLPRIMIYKSKTTIFSLQSNMIITSLFWKLTKVSTKYLKADIKETSGHLKMCKNTISQEMLCHAALEVLQVNYPNPKLLVQTDS